MKNKQIRNSLIFSLVIGILIMTDLIIKHFAFEFPGRVQYQGPSQHDYKIIAIRSYAHTNSTLFSFLKIDTPKYVKILMNSLIGVVMVFVSLICKSKFRVVAIAVMFSGVFGNTFDNIEFDYVRDFLYIPWLDRGTFNISDSLVLIGAILLFISFIKESFKKA